MLTINPVKLTTYSKKNISFGENQKHNTNKVGLMSLDKNQNTRINFEKDVRETQNADMVQSNPIMAFAYNIRKAYNALCTPRRNTEKIESTYIHLPYMA